MKTFKTIYLVGIIFITIFVVGFFGARRIGRMVGWFDNGGVVKDSVKLEPFTSIELDADYVDFNIVEDNEYRVDYEYPSNMNVNGKVENGVLKITVKGTPNTSFSFFQFDKTGIKTVNPSLTVVVPEGTKFDSVDLKANAGDIRLDERIIDSFKAEMDAADLELDSITAEKMNIQTDAGSVEIFDSSIGDLEVSTSAGEISMNSSVSDSVKVSANMGNIEFFNNTFSKGEFKSDMGKISVDGEFEEIKAESSMGEISVENENIGTAKVDLSVDLGKVSVNGVNKGNSYKQN